MALNILHSTIHPPDLQRRFPGMKMWKSFIIVTKHSLKICLSLLEFIPKSWRFFLIHKLQFLRKFLPLVYTIRSFFWKHSKAWDESLTNPGHFWYSHQILNVFVLKEATFSWQILQHASFACRFKDEYNKAIDGVLSSLVKTSLPDSLVFVGELLNGWTFSPKMVC